jgi:hypothetical protein
MEEQGLSRSRFFQLCCCGIGLFACLISTSSAFAQRKEMVGSDIAIHGGFLLPNQIDGVTEIMPFWGLGYARDTSLGMMVFDFYNSNAKGVTFNTLSVSARGERLLADHVIGMILGGVSYNAYMPQGKSSFESVLGAHIGLSAMTYLAESAWISADLRFMASPGTSLSIGASLIFRSRPKTQR